MGSILIIAGENSGEKHGAQLVRQFKKIQPSFTFYGIGGQHMAEEGVRLLYSVEDLALVGFFEIITHIPRLKRIFNHLEKETQRSNPVAAVLIDSPDFNLRLAKRLKKLSIPVLYYVSPTVWAWRRRRLKAIKKTVEKMLLIFPFEEKIYKQNSIPAIYIGHPLKERVKLSLSRENFLKKHKLDSGKIIILILPGSRKSEVKYHMPTLIQAIENIKREFDAQFLLLLAENLKEDHVTSVIPPHLDKLKILKQDGYEALAYSDIALSSCGTANLEAALLGTPVVSFYRISPLSYHLGVRFVKIKNYSIVNILAGEKVIPELIQRHFTAENLLRETRRILGSETVRSEMRVHFDRINYLLGDKVASENAARELEKMVSLANS
ncbi:MAG: lipid-A-disaccharide synthase [Candidatus Aminicenantes bacterium]|nr:lipid-A-disaccharide synthase [Candidatus Aminicenantes bacterium]MDH5743352.1 lipid-A-disaccharide synthase [Candidatus Aminicenantes bacterium]